jgi:hypothetical protein
MAKSGHDLLPDRGFARSGSARFHLTKVTGTIELMAAGGLIALATTRYAVWTCSRLPAAST